MRKMTMITAAAALLGMGTAAEAQTVPPPAPHPSIRVTGVGEVRAAPDQATADFAVETTASNAQEAAAANAQQMDRVIAALVRAGVPRDRIETRDYNVFPDYDPRTMETGEPRIRGYRVMNTVSATTHDIDGVGALIDAALAAGANRVHGVRFGLRDPQRFRAQAIQEATRRARADAEALASAMGVRLGMIREASTLDVGYGGPSPVMLERAAMADMAAQSVPTPINPGEQVVRATVSVVYAFSN